MALKTRFNQLAAMQLELEAKIAVADAGSCADENE